VNEVPRVLVTGGSGFLGLPCVRRAVAAGAEVHAAARQVRVCLPPGVRFHAVDLFDAGRVAELLAGLRPTHLLHLAWVATPGAYWTSPDNPRWVEASDGLLRSFAAAGGRRAVVAGTCAEYDWAVAGRCHETATPVRPATLYGACKAELRWRTEAFARASGLSAAWARLFFLYGPREHPARLVPSVARALLAGQPAECSAGTQQRDFLHVEDAADALVRLLLGSLTGPVNVGSGEAATVRAVVEAVAVAAGRPELLRLGARPVPPTEPALLVADVGRLRGELGWAPRIDLGRGLADTVAWWKEEARAAHD
jgi:nucleoside-diphosphate-sugar epimerase